MCLDVGGWRRHGHSLHLDASFAHEEVVDGAIASFKVGLQAESLAKDRLDGAVRRTFGSKIPKK